MAFAERWLHRDHDYIQVIEDSDSCCLASPSAPNNKISLEEMIWSELGSRLEGANLNYVTMYVSV